MDELAKALIQYNISISSVESFTVGNFAAMLGSIPGISKVYRGSLVTYQSETKERLLGIHCLHKHFSIFYKIINSTNHRYYRCNPSQNRRYINA